MRYGYREYDTGKLRSFDNMHDAVVDAKNHLQGWMNPDDKIGTFKVDASCYEEDVDNFRHVIVLTCFGEDTDAGVLIRPIKREET